MDVGLTWAKRRVLEVKKGVERSISPTIIRVGIFYVWKMGIPIRYCKTDKDLCVPIMGPIMGLPYLKIKKKVSWFFVSWFQRMLHVFKRYLVPLITFPFHGFLIDIKFISKIL